VPASCSWSTTGWATRPGSAKSDGPGPAPKKPPIKRPSKRQTAAEAEDTVSMLEMGPGFDGPACRGADCCGFKSSRLMEGEQIPRFFPDARCDKDAACDHGPYVRAPLAGIFPHSSTAATRILRATEDCQPAGLEAARGLVLLDCRTRLHVLTQSGWVEELAPTYPSDNWLSYTIAADGTLIVVGVGKDERPHAAWLRLPLEPGARGARSRCPTPAGMRRSRVGAPRS